MAEFELCSIDLGIPHIVGKAELQLDLLAERAVQQLGGGADKLIDVRRPRQQSLLARERQKLPRQIGRTLRGIADPAHLLAQLGMEAPILLQVFDVGHDDHEDVVEVVRHAAGQLADRLHLLGLPKLLLGMVVVRHVAADEVVLAIGLRPNRHPVQRNRTAILVDIAAAEMPDGSAAASRAHLVAGCLEIIGKSECRARLADHFFRPIAQHLDRAGTGLQELALIIAHQDQILRRFEDAVALALGQAALGHGVP